MGGVANQSAQFEGSREIFEGAYAEGGIALLKFEYPKRHRCSFTTQIRPLIQTTLDHPIALRYVSPQRNSPPSTQAEIAPLHSTAIARTKQWPWRNPKKPATPTVRGDRRTFSQPSHRSVWKSPKTQKRFTPVGANPLETFCLSVRKHDAYRQAGQITHAHTQRPREKTAAPTDLPASNAADRRFTRKSRARTNIPSGQKKFKKSALYKSRPPP